MCSEGSHVRGDHRGRGGVPLPVRTARTAKEPLRCRAYHTPARARGPGQPRRGSPLVHPCPVVGRAFDVPDVRHHRFQWARSALRVLAAPDGPVARPHAARTWPRCPGRHRGRFVPARISRRRKDPGAGRFSTRVESLHVQTVSRRREVLAGETFDGRSSDSPTPVPLGTRRVSIPVDGVTRL